MCVCTRASVSVQCEVHSTRVSVCVQVFTGQCEGQHGVCVCARVRLSVCSVKCTARVCRVCVQVFTGQCEGQHGVCVCVCAACVQCAV